MTVGGRPQQTDSIVRTVTTALMAVSLVGSVIYLAISTTPGARLTGLQAVLVGWAGVVVGFYFGGHVAQNTAALEEARQLKATESAEASSVRAEASSLRAEAASGPPATEEPSEPGVRLPL